MNILPFASLFCLVASSPLHPFHHRRPHCHHRNSTYVTTTVLSTDIPSSTTTYSPTQTSPTTTTTTSTETTTTNTSSPTTPATVGITAAELGLHNTLSNCWVAFESNVYDFSAWTGLHPAGSQIFATDNVCGTTNFEAAFTAQHGTTQVSRFYQATTLVGPYLG